MIIITPAGVLTATSYPLTYDIREKLCKSYCINNENQPIVTVTPSITGTQTVGAIVYSTIQFLVSVNYLPKGRCNTCGRVTNTFIENVQVSGTSAAAIASTSQGFSDPYYTSSSNCNIAQGVECVGNITLSFT